MMFMDIYIVGSMGHRKWQYKIIDLNSLGAKQTPFSSPGLAIFLNLHTTRDAEMTSKPDCKPKNMSEREEDSLPKAMEIAPSAPLYIILRMLMAIAYCCKRR